MRAYLPVCLGFLLFFSMLAVSYTQEIGGGTPAQLSSVFDKPRLEEEDVIYFRNNDILRGQVLNEQLSITTPYGRITLPTRRCAGVSFEASQAKIETIVTGNLNRFTGMISDHVIRFRIASSGAEIPLRKEKIRFILLKRTPEENDFIDPASKTDLFVMINGDLLTGKPVNPNVRIQTDYGEIPVSFSEMRTMKMESGDDVTASIKKKNGDTMSGLLQTDEITINLDLGIELAAVHKDRFSEILVDDGHTQVALHFDAIPLAREELYEALFAADSRPLTGARINPQTGLEEITVDIPGLPAGAKQLELVLIPAGRFIMGSPDTELARDDDEGPPHQVTISRQFYLGMYEVTQAQWKAVMGTNPSKYSGQQNQPVENVSWEDCQEFLERLNEQGLGTFRLPTEAEWEYACRAGTKSRFYWGEDFIYSGIDEYAWYHGNSGSQPHEVGEKKPNRWGLYDMCGDVWEWCQDWYGAYLTESQTDTRGPMSGSGRVYRGGGWRSVAANCRSACRDAFPSDSRHAHVGFRLVRLYP